MGIPNHVTDASVSITMKNKIDSTHPNRQAAALAADTIILAASLKMKHVIGLDPKKGLRFDVFLKSGELVDGLSIDDTVEGDILEGERIERIQMSYNVNNRFEIKTKAVYEGDMFVVRAETKEIPNF